MIRKKLAAISCALVAALAVCALGGCSSQGASSSSAASSSSTETSATASSTSSSAASSTSGAAANASALGAVANTLAQDEQALVDAYASKFQQAEYTDATTGLAVTYNLFLPAGYDQSKTYPMVVFIADSTSVGSDPTVSLTQGLGALVWASDEWQAVNECIVCVPSYPETVLDDHGSYTTTEYVELTKRLIESVSSTYAVDTNRIYGTGQSMGCMTTLVLASEYPDLYAGCMFVDGQWDVSTLKNLEGQTFVYFAAEDDTNAFTGMNEVMGMFDADGASYSYAQWDGTWTPDELSAAATELFAAGEEANFISWKTGTIDSSSASMGGSGNGGKGGGMPGGSQPSGSSASEQSGADASSASASGSAPASGGSSGGMGSASYHMASFDYAYNCVAVMEWLFQQSK